jgi:hypothetical protein
MKDFIERAFALTEAVSRLKERSRVFFYQVMLSGYACLRCDGSLEMQSEGSCRCASCRSQFDPTITFQRCDACGGKLELQVRRYRCCECGVDVRSRFLFDGLVFDVDYFRQKMVESRQRKAEQCERVRQMLAESRSGTVQLPVADLNSIPGLADVLNALTQDVETYFDLPPSSNFNLKHYQAHIQAHLQPFPISLEQIPPLSENARKDKIWRFIALIFLAHTGIVDIWQDGQDIMVKKNETNAEGSGIPGDLEATDGIEGSVGRIEA